MSWILDATGVGGWPADPFESGAAAWRPLLNALGRASHVALAAAYLVVIAHLLRLYRGRGRVRTVADLLRQVSLLLCFCALAHAGDALSSSLTHHRLLTAPSVLAAVFASIAATKLPALARGPEGMGAGAGGPRAAPAEAGTAAAVSAAPPDRSASAGGDARFERLTARVARVEDAARRNAWIRQCQDEVRRLDALLAGDPGAPPEPGAGPAPGGRGPGA